MGFEAQALLGVWCPGLREAGQLLWAPCPPGTSVVTCVSLPFLPGCGGYLRAAQGTFNSPYYPGHYPPNINCTWHIEVGAVSCGGLEKLVGGRWGRRGRGWACSREDRGGGVPGRQERGR